MLYEFHKSQNAKIPNSIHATYLVYGTKTVEQPSRTAPEDNDVEMSSSMPDGEFVAEQIPIVTLSLVQETELKSTANPQPSQT